MAEGLDDVARAFQTEIAPASERPRDQTGKFVSTSKPEPMFQPRPVEGDPLTGDTRDGGDNARLAQIERRIADGRAEEGDEQSLSDGARARNADGRGRHQPAQDEQGGRREGEPEQQDQDGQGDDEAAPGEDGKGDAEGSPERDAESQSRFRVTTLDGEPVEKFEVTVDGRPEQVTLDEALSGYIKDSTFKTRLNQVHQQRQAIEQEAQGVAQTRDFYIQRLAMLDRELAELTPQEPNWDQEFAADPRQAHEKQKAYAAIYGKRQQIAREMQQADAQARAEYDRKSQAYAVEQFTQFVTEAKIPDEPALQKELTSMRAYLRKEGFSEAEIATVFDKRMLHVARKAAKYDQSETARPKAVPPGRGKALIPGAARPIGSAARRHIDEAQQKLAKSGRLEDAASVMARLIR